MPRIITEDDGFGHWSAWFDGHPCHAFGGDLPTVAVERLLRETGHDPALIVADYTANRDGHMEFTLATGICSECGGSGRYVGLHEVKVCGACGGSGRR